MRIGYLIHSLARGGAETLLARHIRCLDDFTDEQIVFVASDTLTLKSDCESAGATVIDLPQPTKDAPMNVLRVASEVRRANIDILHTHLPQGHFLGRIATVLSDTPVISTYHSTPSDKTYESIFGRLDSATRLLSAANVANSRSVCQGHNRPFETWRTIPNAIDVEAFAEKVSQASELDAPTTGPVVLNVGRCTSQKRQSMFLDTVAHIRKQSPELDIGAYLVGWGDLEMDLREHARHLGIDDVVKFTGEVDSVAPYYTTADVFCITSRYEGFGLVAIEAMAAGLPVVATKVRGLRDVIGGKAGELVREDPEILSDAVRKVVSTDEKLSEAAYNHVLENFDIGAYRDAHLTLYQRVAGT